MLILKKKSIIFLIRQRVEDIRKAKDCLVTRSEVNADDISPIKIRSNNTGLLLWKSLKPFM